jgi:hypothetical protein
MNRNISVDNSLRALSDEYMLLVGCEHPLARARRQAIIKERNEIRDS